MSVVGSTGGSVGSGSPPNRTYCRSIQPALILVPSESSVISIYPQFVSPEVVCSRISISKPEGSWPSTRLSALLFLCTFRLSEDTVHIRISSSGVSEPEQQTRPMISRKQRIKPRSIGRVFLDLRLEKSILGNLSLGNLKGNEYFILNLLLFISFLIAVIIQLITINVNL